MGQIEFPPAPVASAPVHEVLPPPVPSGVDPLHVRGAPPPRQGGPIVLLRFMRAHGMLIRRYLRLLVRLAWWKQRLRLRLQLDGFPFIGPGVSLEVGRG